MASKKDKHQTNIDFSNFFKDFTDTEEDGSYEKALSESLIYAMKKFNKTSEASKWDSKAMAILSKANPTMKELCEQIIYSRKDRKRRRSKEWKEIIKSIARSIHKQQYDERDGRFSFLHR